MVLCPNICWIMVFKGLCKEFEALMHDKFQMSAMGELTFFLGLQVLQKKDGIFLSQDKYVGGILKKFRYSDVRSANTPMDKENHWEKDGPGKDVELHLYRSMIGFLMYLTASRPDIMFVFHEAHMESSNNDAQDACNADVSESIGIFNPTATSKSPPAEQMESLTIESKFPTVSSPVLTVFLDTSPKTSSGSRLILKRVISQEETPSLDNALTLSNRFEDTIGVEADLSNIESGIPASPTPTFRIHKDHPKSQIISPVDTPDEPKKIVDSLKDPSWEEAMQEELFQFKIQNVWILVDCPKGIRPIGTKWVLKNKKDERGIVIKNKARLFHEAHMESSNNDAQDACNADVSESIGIFNPTATSKSPPAEQMESLTIESKFPTVSSPVLTVFLDTSPKTSSGSRLILKRVISQEETPSLDNALTLSNRFEDTIGVE
nr:ribonuclease H-like domain, reverse transcriptase, RNA-dependent DNA polymerase [Tanacetum cinerariifolium]